MMMNQGGNTETVASLQHNSLENRHILDASEGQDSSYLPSTTRFEAVSWNVHRVDNYPTENGVFSNSTYNYDQLTQQPTTNVQDGSNMASLGSSLNSGTVNVAQDYNGYASYTSSTDPYGYGSTGYTGYYNGNQQSNNSYSHPFGAYQNTGAPYQPLSSFQNTGSYAGPASYSSTYYNRGDYQTTGVYPSSSYTNQTSLWDGGNHANYTSHQYPNYTPDSTGAYSSGTAAATSLNYQQHYKQWADYYNQTEVSCAPGTENMSVVNTSNLFNTGSLILGVSGGYPTSNSQPPPPPPPPYTTSNSQPLPPPPPPPPPYTTSNSQPLPPPPPTPPYTTSNSQPLPPPPPYPTSNSQLPPPPPYPTSNSQPLLPPNTYPTSNSQSLPPPPLYPTSNSQPLPPPAPPPLVTLSWRPESTSSDLALSQPGAVATGAHDGYWKPGAPSFQNHHASTMQPLFQKPMDSKISYESFQDQQETTYPQGPSLQHPTAHKASQTYQSPVQTVPSLDIRRVSKLQIPTNPRIASILALGLPKTDKEGSTTSAAAKPAYISVSLPKAMDKQLSHEVAESILKPGMFPKSLRGYVERALARCNDDDQMAACQAVLNEMITKATTDGTLSTRDWDMEPLFSQPSANAINDLQCSTPVSSLPKYKRSPSRRSKSRWETLSEEKSVYKAVPTSKDEVKYGSWFQFNEKDRKLLSGNSGRKEDVLSNAKFTPLGQKNAIKNAQRPVKRQRLADGFSAAYNGDALSDSDKEQSLTAYYSGAIALANSPEERKRRENRSKRFENRQRHRAEINHFKPKNAGAGNLYVRRASALVRSKNFEDGGSRAVEDIDWDALTVKGTCQEIEKRYLRLTSAPDPASVRPEDVLEKALLMVQNSQKNYLNKCDQLKSIRQDLTVQRIRNGLTAKVYETHARLALEMGDLPEYNQCQSQLKTLYAEGIEGCHMEFSAYNLLCVILHSNNNREFLSSMSRLSGEAKKDEAVKHALAVHAAVTSGNYVMFFRLYEAAPNLNTCLMDLYVEKMRYKAVSCMSRSYRPTLPVSYIARVLGFTSVIPTNEGGDEKESDGLEECAEWLKVHGASVIADSNGEMQLDTKASSTSLYMPEPEDAVAHGDSNLDVNDFLTRTL